MHEEELFGPAEGLHSTYRMLRDEVLESSWKAGSAISEMRLDTIDDVNTAVARYLELVKLAALIQSPGAESAPEALAAINELLGRVATPEQRIAIEASALDRHVIGSERERDTRREQVAARREPSLEQFLPRRKGGLGLSASDIDLYRTCPLKYKFARVFAIPQEPTINQRFGILMHQVLERFHAEELRAASGGDQPAGRATPADSTGCSTCSRRGGADRGSAPPTTSCSTATARWRRSPVTSSATSARTHSPCGWSGTSPLRSARTSSAGRVDRVDRRADGGYELIDYKTGDPGSGPRLTGDVQLALYRLGAREAWQIDAGVGSYWYVLADERVRLEAEPDDAERVERTVLEVAGGIEEQDFEPRPSHEICSWCDYRLICPASEA